MKKRIRPFVLSGIASLFLLLVACGGGGGGESEHSYDGKWVSSPFCDFDGQFNANLTNTVTISGNSSTQTVKRYATSDCSGNPDITVVVKLAFKYGEERASASSVCSNTRDVDVTIVSGTLNGAALSVQAIQNLIDFPGSTIYDLICSSENRLYSGKYTSSNDATTAAKRPTLIDDTDFLVK